MCVCVATRCVFVVLATSSIRILAGNDYVMWRARMCVFFCSGLRDASRIEDAQEFILDYPFSMEEGAFASRGRFRRAAHTHSAFAPCCQERIA